MEDILEEFLLESRELVEASSAALLSLEHNPKDEDSLQELFRSLHTIKGVAGFLELTPLTEIVHSGEELLDEARQGTLSITTDLATHLLSLLDCISVWLDALENEGQLPDDAEAISKAFCKALEAAAEMARGTDSPKSPRRATPPPIPAIALPLSSVPTPEEREPPQPATLTPMESPSLDAAVDPNAKAAVELLKCQSEILRSSPLHIPLDGMLSSTRLVVERISTALGDDLSWDVDEAHLQCLQSGTTEPLATLVDQYVESLDIAVSTPERAAKPPRTPTPEAPVKAAVASPAPAAALPTPKQARQAIRSLRVSQEKIDVLMDLIGELVVAKNSLPFLARRAAELAQPTLSRDLKANYSTIHRISEDLQNAVMQVRMVPVGHAFQRFPRLVRDLSHKLGKNIQLQIEGEETPVDKNMAEEISEPLIHMIRNATDHGIESPEERERQGKPAQARIGLRAIQQDDRIIIELTDDGRGIDPCKIRDKAIEKGLITAHDATRLDDRDMLQLIFLPGFSMAEEVSEVSGRGVGMDVVRTVVERLGSTIEMNSVLGEGTQIKLSLPQSMKISRVMVVEVGGERFGVPIEPIVETVRLMPEDIHMIKSQEMLILRNRLLPLYRLRKVLQIDGEETNPLGTKVLVAQVGSETFGLAVDRFMESVDIILKPLEGIMGTFGVFSGTTLMGDGKVLLILDLQEILRCI